MFAEMLQTPTKSKTSQNSTKQIVLAAPTWKTRLRQAEHYSSLIWEKVVIVLLLVDGAHGLFTSGAFFIVQFPELDRKLSESLITAAEMRIVMAEAIGLIIATIIGISLAIRLTKDQEKLFRYIELVIGTAFIIKHREITEYLSAYDYTPITTVIKTWLTNTF